MPEGQQLNNQFMTLLVAQIKNQDPLNPADGTEFVSQMAQLAGSGHGEHGKAAQEQYRSDGENADHGNGQFGWAASDG